MQAEARTHDKAASPILVITRSPYPRARLCPRERLTPAAAISPSRPGSLTEKSCLRSQPGPDTQNEYTEQIGAKPETALQVCGVAGFPGGVLEVQGIGRKIRVSGDGSSRPRERRGGKNYEAQH